MKRKCEKTIESDSTYTRRYHQSTSQSTGSGPFQWPKNQEKIKLGFRSTLRCDLGSITKQSLKSRNWMKMEVRYWGNGEFKRVGT